MTDTDARPATGAGNNAKWLFALLIGIPIAVIGFSTALYFLADEQVLDLGTVNRGELVDPPRELAALAMRRESGELADLYRHRDSTWQFVVIAPAGCDTRCEKMVYLTRQTHVALGKKSPRVSRALLLGESAVAVDAEISDRYVDLNILRVNESALGQLLDGVLLDQGSPGFYIVDPMGWLMMRYEVADLEQATLNQLGKDVLKDMRRLLR